MTAHVPQRLDLVSSQAPAISRSAFAEAFSRMASTVCVISGSDGGTFHGRTATAVLSLTIEPPTVVVSVKGGCPLARVIRATGGFSLAMLSRGQERVADAFAGKVEPAQRHLIGVWGAWPSGRPHLIGSAAAIDCELAGAIAAADHELFVGTIIATDVPERSQPLLWANRRYGFLRDGEVTGA